MKYLLIALLLTPLALAGPYRPPTPAQAARVRVTSTLSGADVSRVKVGHQAGILKILDRDGYTERFLKGRGTWNGGGIDGVKWAPVSTAERDEMVEALEITDVEATAVGLIQQYPRLARLPAVALLGVLATPGKSNLSPATQGEVVNFLRGRLKPEEDAPTRRQAVLALALLPETNAQTVAAVVGFLKRDHNHWNTFTTVQFFQYQRSRLGSLPELVKAVEATDNPHVETIVEILQSPVSSVHPR